MKDKQTVTLLLQLLANVAIARLRCGEKMYRAL